MAERRFTILFYTAVVTAAAATFGVYRVLQKAKEGSRIETQPVAIAARDISEGEPIVRRAVSVKEWPVQTVPAGAFGNADSVVGRVTRVAIFAGEPIVPGRLAPPGTGPGLAVKITPGKRAMAVKINDVAASGGFIQPNSRVDVLVTLREVGAQGEQVAKMFMTNMRVLSVGTEVQPGDDGRPIQASTATIEVTPEEAERLAVAMNQGNIQLVLRGYGDPDSVATPGARSTDVLAQLRSAPEHPIQELAKPRPVRTGQHPTARPAPAPRPPVPQQVVAQQPRSMSRKPDSAVVQVYRGGKMSQQKFEKTGKADSSKADTSGAERP
jgi:pilus assembly protein CpaB